MNDRSVNLDRDFPMESGIRHLGRSRISFDEVLELSFSGLLH